MAEISKEKIEDKGQLMDFKVRPRKLSKWMTESQRNRNIVLLDLDIEETEYLNFYLDVGFNPIPIKRGLVVKEDFYIGCTAAQIDFSIKSGHIIEHTQSSSITVQHENSKSVNQKKNTTLNPKVKLGNKNRQIESELGLVDYSNTTNQASKIKYDLEESTLLPVSTNKSVKWELAQPNGEKLVRDYLMGNLYLSVKCVGKDEIGSGEIKARPSDIRFFGSDKKALSLRASIMMRFVLFKKGISLDNENGIEVRFKRG